MNTLAYSFAAENNTEVDFPVQNGDVVAGRYQVEKLLGAGGMGAVVAAFDRARDQRVALKFMLPKALIFSNAAQRFIREGHAQSKLRGEHVARVLDVGTLDDGLPFIVMEYLCGIDLAKLLARCLYLRQSEASALIIQVCNAMSEAHSLGIIHRDLKPSNLFVTLASDGALKVKVLDFGISKIVKGDGNVPFETTTIGTIGSPAYMSPEQAKSAKYADSRSDIWSLGVLLYQLTTGEFPFVAESPAEILAKILYECPLPMCERAPWVTAGFESVVMRCLAKDPDRRYQSAEALASTLRPFAEEREPGADDITIRTGRKPGEYSSARIVYQPEAIKSLFPHVVPTDIRFAVSSGAPDPDDDSGSYTEPMLTGSAIGIQPEFAAVGAVRHAGLSSRPRRIVVMAFAIAAVAATALPVMWYSKSVSSADGPRSSQTPGLGSSEVESRHPPPSTAMQRKADERASAPVTTSVRGEYGASAGPGESHRHVPSTAEEIDDTRDEPGATARHPGEPTADQPSRTASKADEPVPTKVLRRTKRRKARTGIARKRRTATEKRTVKAKTARASGGRRAGKRTRARTATTSGDRRAGKRTRARTTTRPGRGKPTKGNPWPDVL
ncbi:MAG: protein kinase [Proteobacteria bacterium]|nr:protein kinase [Pseudomonadota bacterium]